MSATIDHAHGEPARVVQPGEDVREDVLERAEGCRRRSRARLSRPAEREDRLVAGVVDAAVAPRVAAQQRASPRARLRARSPNSRKRVDRVLRAARVVLARAGGVRRPNVQRHAWTRPMPRYSHASRPLEDVRDLGDEPVLPAVVGRLGEAGARARGRSPARRERSEGARATPRAAAASRGSARPPSRPSAAPPDRGRGSPSGSSSRGNQCRTRYRLDAERPRR